MSVVCETWKTREDGVVIDVFRSDKLRGLVCDQTGEEYPFGADAVHEVHGNGRTYSEIRYPVGDVRGARAYMVNHDQECDTGDTVTYAGYLWVATQDGLVNVAPGDGVEGWEKVEDVTGLLEWSSARTYEDGEIVYYNYKVYKADGAVKGYDPTVCGWAVYYPAYPVPEDAENLPEGVGA